MAHEPASPAPTIRAAATTLGRHITAWKISHHRNNRLSYAILYRKIDYRHCLENQPFCIETIDQHMPFCIQTIDYRHARKICHFVSKQLTIIIARKICHFVSKQSTSIRHFVSKQSTIIMPGKSAILYRNNRL
jgi:hypothetical protein